MRLTFNVIMRLIEILPNQSRYLQKYNGIIKRFDQKEQDVWGNSYLSMYGDWKPGGTGIFSFD